MPQSATTPWATTLDLAQDFTSSNEDVARILHPLYGPALARAPRGDLAARGLPFKMADAAAERRWLLVDRPVDIALGGISATHLVLLHFCDAWREAESDDRPAGTPVGWVIRVGEALARARIRRHPGEDVEITLRRRFEVNEGIIGWGSMAYLAVPHHAEAPVDWRGPHPKLPIGRYAAPGHTGPMTVLPASWGANQTGVEDHVPSPTDDLTLWLHAIDVRDDGAPSRLDSIELSPLPGPGAGRSVIVAAMTAFSGRSSPLRWLPRRSLRLAGAGGADVDVDLGVVARRRAIPAAPASAEVIGWGIARGPLSGDEELELTAAEDAALIIKGERAVLRDVTGVEASVGASGVRVRLLEPAARRLHVTLLDPLGRRTAGRVRAVAVDGRYLPPLGHRHEVNPGLSEDLGADVIVGDAEYAYTDGAFDIDLPAEGAVLEAVSGFRRLPVRAQVSPADITRGALELRFGEPLAPAEGRWVCGDTHVHFLAPSTALLQAKAEDVNVVHLLATQWGDHHTSVTDIGGDVVGEDGEHAVWVGSENRQNMLGHIGLVGARRPVLPFASGGPPEGPIGGSVDLLMADWLSRCREEGGLCIGAHFPLPLAEVPADIAWDLLDALEFETLDATLENPGIREWYRYLDAGYRLPVVGGTDKMTASVPLGQIRTWASLEGDDVLSFEAWSAAVRAGRTFVSSGPLLDLRVEGLGPGETITADRGASLEVALVARAAQPVITVVELVMDGEVVASEERATPQRELAVRHRVRVERSGWLAGRSRSPFAIGSAFATAMAAHTSPVYLSCPAGPRRQVDMTEPLAVIDGTRAWLEQLAPIRDRETLKRFVRFLDEGERRLRERGPRS